MRNVSQLLPIDLQHSGFMKGLDKIPKQTKFFLYSVLL